MAVILVIMDPPHLIHAKKDSTVAMIEAAHKRECKIYICEAKDLRIEYGGLMVQATLLQPFDDLNDWYQPAESAYLAVTAFQCILMRQDPPYDMAYLHTTHLLSLAESMGVKVDNPPQALRDWNEKLSITGFSDYTPPTIVTSDMALIKRFVSNHEQAVIKPLDGMGGQGIFLLGTHDPNLTALIELSTHEGKTLVMVQRYLPEIKEGDKRILILHGEPVPFALARIPKEGNLKGNLAAGGQGEVRPLTTRDRALCAALEGFIAENKLGLVGLDVIGDWITEINITSPTCFREISAHSETDLALQYIDGLLAS